MPEQAEEREAEYTSDEYSSRHRVTMDSLRCLTREVGQIGEDGRLAYIICGSAAILVLAHALSITPVTLSDRHGIPCATYGDISGRRSGRQHHLQEGEPLNFTPWQAGLRAVFDREIGDIDIIPLRPHHLLKGVEPHRRHKINRVIARHLGPYPKFTPIDTNPEKLRHNTSIDIVKAVCADGVYYIEAPRVMVAGKIDQLLRAQAREDNLFNFEPDAFFSPKRLPEAEGVVLWAANFAEQIYQTNGAAWIGATVDEQVSLRCLPDEAALPIHDQRFLESPLYGMLTGALMRRYPLFEALLGQALELQVQLASDPGDEYLAYVCPVFENQLIRIMKLLLAHPHAGLFDVRQLFSIESAQNYPWLVENTVTLLEQTTVLSEDEIQEALAIWLQLLRLDGLDRHIMLLKDRCPWIAHSGMRRLIAEQLAVVGNSTVRAQNLLYIIMTLGLNLDDDLIGPRMPADTYFNGLIDNIEPLLPLLHAGHRDVIEHAITGYEQRRNCATHQARLP
jgi:hypothetical protein